jgi:hypothetical protein
MAIEVTINLDSGCCLPIKKLDSGGYSAEIGYFQNPPGSPDIRVFVDSDERQFDPPLELGGDNCRIDVIHKNADGTTRSDGVKACNSFHDQLLHLKDLYGEDIRMDPLKFDCIFRFETGRLLPSMVKKRAFKESKKDQYGQFTPTGNRKTHTQVSHNLVFHFTLEKDEVLEWSRNGKVFLSSEDLGVKTRLEIEIPVDNSVANKFYHDGFLNSRPDDVYWLPNEGDPPPNCSWPPCPDGG